MHELFLSDPAASRQPFYESVFKQAGWGIAISSGDGRCFKLVNAAFARMHGYREDELIGQPITTVFAPEAHGQLDGHIARVHVQGRHVWESVHRRRDGSTFPVLIDASEVRDACSDELCRVVNVLDISEHKQVEQALLRTQQQLRALSAHHETMLENERKRIAREVHDELGQLLTALNMDVSLLGMKFGHHPEILQATTGMHQLVERTIAVVRHVASHLRPAALDLGLVAAIEWLAEDFRLRWETPCTVVLPDEDDCLDLDERLATAAFRIVQESLTNIARHALARQVSITLTRRADALELTVVDDGRGFHVASATSRAGFGLLGMRERVLALGGRLDLRSQPGQGTRVHIELPLNLKNQTST